MEMNAARDLSVGQRVIGRAEHRHRLESALLGHLVLLHPARITETELIRELAADPEDVADRADVTQAIAALAAVGLVYQNGRLVLPSAAALRAYELWQV